MEETAYAKLNLSLKVLGREPDGYHRIDTLFAFCEDGDVLRVEAGEDLTLRIEGPFASDVPQGDGNLVLRAARAFGVGRGAALTLDKRLPVASGIGGGSADAAAALRVLNCFWSLGLSEAALLDLARPLGADVPACLLSRALRGQGKGDELTPAKAPSGSPVLLVNPRVAVSTAEVFGRWKGVPGEGNDLERPALEVAPVIGDVLEYIRRLDGAARIGMSGSGATCFAIFEDAGSLDSVVVPPGWWSLKTRLR